MADQARADQAEAKEREFDRKAVKGARLMLALIAFPLAGYSWLGINGMVPLPDWSPVNQQEVERVPPLDLPKRVPAPSPSEPSVSI